MRFVVEVLSFIPLRARDLVARHGGENLSFFCPEPMLLEPGAHRIAELIRAQVGSMRLIHEADPRGGLGRVVTISIGASTTLFKAKRESSVLIHNADCAQYAAKSQGATTSSFEAAE